MRIQDLFSSDIGVNGLLRPFNIGVPVTFIVYFLLIAEKNNLVFGKFFVLLGDASYSIYLTHVLTLSAVGRIWSVFNSESIIDNLIIIPIMLILTCMVGLVSYLWIEIPLSKYLKKVIS